jgi:type II secretory pathway predicted ATPase ExeA/peptidoglycan hydrolase-like protein with peptidoglycan-binding domain
MSLAMVLPPHLLSLGFTRNPFPQTPDADCYFRTEKLAQQSSEAFHCLTAGKGFVLLTGEVGTGKSTFLRTLMDDLLEHHCSVSFVFNTFLQGRDLLLALNRDFGLTPGVDLAEDIDKLNHYLIERYAEGKCCVLVIDDAQNLDSSSLELLRLLSSLETRQTKLLQIVLSGQPELVGLLQKTETRQLASRIVQHIQLHPLSRVECERYVNFRISRAGTDGRIVISSLANYFLHWFSKGNPRRIHTIMDRCLYGVRAGANQEISVQLILMGAREGGIKNKEVGQRKWPWMAITVGVVAIAVMSSNQWRPWLGNNSALTSPIAHASEDNNGLMNSGNQRNANQELLKDAPNASLKLTQVEQTKRSDNLACLQKFGVGDLLADIEDGVDASKHRVTMRLLERSGVTMAMLPAGLKLSNNFKGKTKLYCSSQTAAGTWVIWRPTFLPFEISRGNESEAVLWLQERLRIHQLYSEKIDGRAGRATLAALKTFQQQHGISSNEYVDAWTLYLLEHDSGA